MKRVTQSLAPRLALSLGTLLLLLLLGEITARVLAWSRTPPAPVPTAESSLPVLTDVFELARPNTHGLYQGVPYRTNSHGIRGPEYAEHPDADVFRILVVGDSVTMGWAVREELAYPARLAPLLEEAGPDHPAWRAGRRFEVLNLGLAGVNAGFSSKRLERFIELYHPDLTIYGFTLNDIEGPHYRKLPRDERKALRQETWRRALRFADSPSYLLRELWPRVIGVIEWDVFHPSEAERIAPQAAEWYQNYFENPEAWADFEAALDLHARAAQASGICGQVFLHTHLTELTPEHRHKPVYDRVAAAARARGLSVSESFPWFVGRDGDILHVNAFDIHPNAQGHELLAQALFEGLRALPPQCLRSAAERRR